jgi:hypothetical protein
MPLSSAALVLALDCVREVEHVLVLLFGLVVELVLGLLFVLDVVLVLCRCSTTVQVSPNQV